MSLTLSLDGLIAYSDHERRKWREWIAADPSRLRIPFQPGGRFPDVGSILDHVFLVERRHLSRLEGAAPPDATGIAPGDADALFEYADLVRADLRAYASSADDESGGESIVITGLRSAPGTIAMSRRRLATHILLHEIRHLAQIAYAARLAGHEPPGQHDIFYFEEFS